MQSLSVESDAPQQPWHEDDREHEDEERHGEAGRDEQNDAHEQPGAAKDEKRAPVFGPIDAPTGAEQEFEQLFHRIPVIRCTDTAGGQACVVRKPWGVQARHSDGRILGVMFASSPVGVGNESIAHLMDAPIEVDYPVLSGLI
jgi:hypothetical protein